MGTFNINFTGVKLVDDKLHVIGVTKPDAKGVTAVACTVVTSQGYTKSKVKDNPGAEWRVTFPAPADKVKLRQKIHCYGVLVRADGTRHVWDNALTIQKG